MMTDFEASIDEMTAAMIESGISPADAHNARASVRNQLVEAAQSAAHEPGARMPLLMDEQEVNRLHAIAYNAALQTGAKGERLDAITSALFRQLAAYVGKEAAERMNRREALRIVKEGD